MLYIQLLYLKLSVFSDFLTFKFLLCGLFFNSNSFTHSIISLSLSTSLCHGSFLSSLNPYISLHFWSYPFWVLLLHVSLSWKFHEGLFLYLLIWDLASFVIEVFLSLWQYELGDFGLLGFFCMLIVNFIFVVEIMICSLLFCGFHHCFHTHVGQYSLIAMQKTLNFSIHFFFKLGYKLGSLCFSVPSINGALELWTLMLLQVLSINSSLQI